MDPQAHTSKIMYTHFSYDLVHLVLLFIYLCSSLFHYQNSDVLDLVTIPNVLLNCSSEDVQSKTRYFAGDWESLIDMLDHYDIILTAETIYNPASYSKLLKLFDKALKPNGVMY